MRVYPVSKITQNIESFLERVPPSKLMAVVKYASEDQIKELLDDGRITIIGENKVQDAIRRWGENGVFKDYRKKIQLHFIGYLQKNKIRHALEIFDYIDCIDNIELAKEIDKRATKKIPILIQLKINNRETQHGIEPEKFETLFKEILNLKNISPAGIMSIGPLSNDKNLIRQSYRRAKEIYDKYFSSLNNHDGFKNYFSIGMSGDWQIALEEGSNLLRIGSALFLT